MSAPDWYPNWTGETAVVVASGPSAADVIMDRHAGRFIAIKTSVELCPWADVLYACDFRWWAATKGSMWFRGIKASVNRRAAESGWDVNYLRCSPGSTMEFDDLGRIGWGWNSGFNAVNLAAQFGVKRILLVGFDMTLAHGARWHAHSVNPDANLVERWRKYLDSAAPALEARGIEVLNCSPISALQNYRKVGFPAS